MQRFGAVPERVNGEQRVRAKGAIRALACFGPVGSNPTDASQNNVTDKAEV